MKFSALYEPSDRRPFGSHRGVVTSGFGWSVNFDTDAHTSVAGSDQVIVLVDGWIGGAGSNSAEHVLQRVAYNSERWWDGLAGEFVVVVVDSRRSTIQFLRDLVGVRPLYRSRVSQRVVVASSVRRVVDEPFVSRDVNEVALVRHIAGVSSGDGQTLYSAVSSILPGHLATFSSSDGDTRPALRWTVTDRLEVGLEEAATESRRTVSDALRSTIDGSPAAGFELSGGLDSSSLVGLATAEFGLTRPVGRMLFDDKAADERAYSDAVVGHWNLEVLDAGPHIPSKDEQLQLLGELALPIPLPNGLMSRSLHEAFSLAGCSTVVTGVGGDDAFAAMGSGPRAVDSIRNRDCQAILHFLKWSRRNPKSIWPLLARPMLSEVAGHLLHRDNTAWLSKKAKRIYGSGETGYSPVAQSSWQSINERWSGVSNGRLVGTMENLAREEDVGWLRTTHPFLARPVVETTYGLHPNLATASGGDRSVQRAAFEDLLPARVAQRRSKAEFSDTGWRVLHAAGPLEPLIQGPLADSGLIDISETRERVEAAKRNAGAVRPLATMANTDQWLRWLQV